MMGFREFAKSQYDTIKLRDPALREEKEVFLYPYVKALYWHRVAHELYKKGEFYKARKISQKWARKTGIEIHPVHRSEKDSLLTTGMEWLLERQRSLEIM